MRILVKIGGTLLDDPSSLHSLAAQIAAQAGRVGQRLVIVHGGGKQMTRFLEERGVQSTFVDGLRVTTPEVLEAILNVFAGSVNKGLVSALNRAGALAAGITGIDGCLAEAETLDPRLGSVGRIVRTNPGVLDALLAAGLLPVVACVAGDRDGRVYNVNADQMAVACASGWRADKLLFLTDVEGVRDASGARIPRLSLHESQKLIQEGVAHGGMLAKLNSAHLALHNGLAEVRIARGSDPDVLSRFLSGEPLGTAIMNES